MRRRTGKTVCFWLVMMVLLVSNAEVVADARSIPPVNREQQKTDCTTDAMLVFDGSGSMASTGYNELNTPRIIDARKAMRRVLPRVTYFRKIGLIVYGPGAKNSCKNIHYRLPPQLGNAAQILSELERVEPAGDTPLTQAVKNAADLLNYLERPAVVILVTDGDETCGGNPCRLAQNLYSTAAAITVHVIGFKVRDRFFNWSIQKEDLRVDSKARCLADITGGRYVSTETTEELEAALQRILGCPAITQRSDAHR